MKRIAYLSLGLTLTACGSTTISRAEYDDLAAIVGSGIATPDRGGDFGVVGDALTIARGSLPKGFAMAGDGTVRGTRGGIAYRYRVSCLQAWTLAACDPPAQSAVVHAAWSGELAMAAFTGPIDRTAVLRLDNLATAMATVGGTSELVSQHATFPDDHRTYRLAGTNDLVLFADMPSHFMMGGALASSLRVDAPSGSYSVDAELSMTGEPVAKLVLDADHAYRIDLATGAVTPQ